jgi:WD40 repeat protein
MKFWQMARWFGMVTLVASCTTTPPSLQSQKPQAPPKSNGSNSGSSVATDSPSTKVNPPPVVHGVHAGDITKMSISADGKALLTLDTLGGVRFWPSLAGDVEPVVVHFSQPTQVTLGIRGDTYIAAALDSSGGVQIRRFSRHGELIGTSDLHRDVGFIDMVFVARYGLLLLSADQTLIDLDEAGHIRQVIDVPVGARVVAIHQAAGQVVALAEIGDKRAAFALSGFNTSVNGGTAATSWTTAIALPVTSVLDVSTISQDGTRIAVATAATKTAPNSKPTTIKPQRNVDIELPGPPTVEAFAVVDVSKKASLGEFPLNSPTNPNQGVSIIVVFLSNSEIYYRSATTGRIKIPEPSGATASGSGAVAPVVVDPWEVPGVGAFDEETDFQSTMIAESVISDILVSARGPHVRILDHGKASYLGYRYPRLSPLDTQGDNLVATSANRRDSIMLNLSSGKIAQSKAPVANSSALVDDTHRIGFVVDDKTSQNQLRLYSLVGDSAAVVLPKTSRDAYAVQYGRESGLLALRNNDGDLMFTGYDRATNLLGPLFTVKSYPSAYMTNPALNDGVAALSLKNIDNGATPMMQVTEIRLVPGATADKPKRVVAGATYKLPNAVLQVDAAGNVYALQPSNEPQKEVTVVVYRKDKKLRELKLPGAPQISNDGKLFLVREGMHTSMYNDQGNLLWSRASSQGATLWTSDAKKIVIASDGGVETFDANTGDVSRRCGWEFGLTTQAPENEFHGGIASVCER